MATLTSFDFYQHLVKRLFVLFLCSVPLVGYSQLDLDSGLVAHWRMNGNAGDSSGNAHHGTGVNVTPAIGIDGTAGSALYFNGINSRIDVPYSPQLNLTKLSICAKIKPLGYYTGTCQGNYILCYHGGTTGEYYLAYTDNPSDGGNCSSVDTGSNNFVAQLGANSIPGNLWQDTPIVSNMWHTVVATYDSANVRLYINGVLRKTLAASTPIATGTTGILTIGANQASATPFPYWLNGIIDDVRLYNRALTPTEVAIYANPSLSVIERVDDIKLVKLEFAPNPAKTEVRVTTPGYAIGHDRLELFNSIGQVVRIQSVHSDITTLSLHGLAAGVYLMRYSNAYYTTTARLVKE